MKKQTTFHVPEATKKGYAVAKKGDSINLSFLEANKRRGRVGKGIANTLDTGVQQYTLGNGMLRRLTPIECERLHGFPDDWTRWGVFDGVKKEISDSQRYKMLGNAVSVAVVSAIGDKMIGKQSKKESPLWILEMELELMNLKQVA